jgi:hypothetical protein
VASVAGEPAAPLQHETDRARFLGRGRAVRSALCVLDGGSLSGTTGAVLDPIVSLRQRLAIPQGATVRLAFTTLVAPTRDEALSSERARWPGPRHRSSCTTCESPRTRRISSSAWPTVSFTPIPRFVRLLRSWQGTSSVRPGSGPTGSLATFPSPWSASSVTRSGTSCDSSYGHMSIGT